MLVIYFFVSISRYFTLLSVSDDWTASDDTPATQAPPQPQPQPPTPEDSGGGGVRPKIATPTPDTESSAATSQEEDEEEAVTQPKRRLISEGDKKKEHVNIVFPQPTINLSLSLPGQVPQHPLPLTHSPGPSTLIYSPSLTDSRVRRLNLLSLSLSPQRDFRGTRRRYGDVSGLVTSCRNI